MWAGRLECQDGVGGRRQSFKLGLPNFSVSGGGSGANWPQICLQNVRSAAACLQTAKLGDWSHLISAYFKVRSHVKAGTLLVGGSRRNL